MTYKLPSGLASFETTGGTLPTEEYTVPGRAADRNKALREALKECHRLQSERDALVAAVRPVLPMIPAGAIYIIRALRKAVEDTQP